MIRKILQVYYDKRRVRIAVLANANKLQGGTYLIGFRSAFLLFRYRSQRRVRTVTQPGRLLIRAKKKLLDVVSKVIPPCFIRLTNQSSVVEQFSGQALQVTRSGDIKIFDFKKRSVLTLASKERTQSLIQASRMLQTYLPVVFNKICAQTGGIVEELVPGTALHHTDIHTQARIYKSLLQKVKCFLTRQPHTVFGIVAAKELLREMKGLLSGHYMACVIGRHQNMLVDMLAGAAVIPCHCDLHGGNIIVEDGQSAIIDLETFGIMPFFYDVMFLPLYNSVYFSSGELLSMVYDGAFDSHLDQIFKVGGNYEFKSYKQAMWLVFLLVHFDNRVRREGLRRDKLGEVFAEWLKPIERLEGKRFDDRLSCNNGSGAYFSAGTQQ